MASIGTIPPRSSLRYTERYSEAYLDGLRTQGDPLSDRVVDELAAMGMLDKFHDLLGAVQARADAGSVTCRAFLEASASVPAWANFEEIENGQRMIAAFPIHMGLSLLAGSLCGGAVFQKMQIVTSMTGMFSGEPTRRLDETTKMVLGMAFPGALRPGAKGHQLLVRVRLLHSALRRFLVDSGRYKHPTEVPINQQDLAITLALFDYLNLRSLARMGMRFSARDRAAFHAMWRYAGHVLGIADELLVESVEEQRAFFYASLLHQGRPERIPAATKDLLDGIARTSTRRAPALFDGYRALLHQSCRWLSGNEYVTGMQLADEGENHWSLRLLRATGAASGVLWRAPGGRALLVANGRRVYRRWFALAARRRDRAGEYRVRTSERRHGAAQ
jgi:hypothetical protein